MTGAAIHDLEGAQTCADCGSADHGRATLNGRPGVHMSLGHARGAVVAGAGWTPIGVDVERVDAADALPRLPDVLAPAEVDHVRTAADPRTTFLRHWVRKESMVKIGLVALDGLRQVDLTRVTAETRTEGRTSCRYGRLHLVDWVDRSLGAVVGAAGTEPPAVELFPRTGGGRPR